MKNRYLAHFLGILTLSGCTGNPVKDVGCLLGVTQFGETLATGTTTCFSGTSSSDHSSGMTEKDLAAKKFLEIAEKEGRKPPPMIQSSAAACPGWAKVRFSLNYPMAKAIEIIENTTMAKASFLDYNLDSEALKASKFIHQTCDNPDPSINYRKLGWICPPGDPECAKKKAFAEEYDALQDIGDQTLGFQKFKELLQKYKG